MSGVRAGVQGALHLLDPLAPDWLVRIVAPKPAATPWPDMVRVALSVTGALAAGVISGDTALGALLGLGALTAAFGDQGGPLLARARRVAAGCGGALVGLLLGHVLPPNALAIPIVALAGVLSAFVSAISAVASFGALQFLVLVAVGSGVGRAPVGPVVGAFLVGAAFSFALTALSALLIPDRSGPRHAVAAALDALGALAAAARSGEGVDAARTALAAALATGFDAVTGARAVSPGRRDDLQRLSGVLGAVAQVARTALEAAARDPALLDGLGDRIDVVRRRVLATSAPTPPDLADPDLARAIGRLERLAGTPGAAAPRTRVPLHARVVAFGERIAGGRTLLFAARLGLTLGVAETLIRVLALPHAYWLLLTAAVVLKPDLGSVFARGVQRTLGTIVGVTLGVIVIALVPPGPLLLIPVALFSALFPLGAKRNYGMLSTFITPLVLIFVDLSGGQTRGLAETRLIDTALGAAVVLVIGYLPWPSTWRPRIGRDVAATVDAVAAYAAVAVDGPEPSIGRSRRRAYAALTDLRSDLQAALAEPPPRSRYAAAWWPVVGQLEQLADDLRDASLLDRERGRPSPSAGASHVDTALREIASAMRARRRPAEVALPDRGPLAHAAEDVAALRRLLDGPHWTA